MTVLGIIAEFNPLHQGHMRLITELTSQLSPQLIVCAMSGNFTQRGEPALCSKWLRAKMAVQAGIDLVVEIPYVFSVRSAAFFARGGVTLLGELGCTHLGFGAETVDLETWHRLAELLENEPKSFQHTIAKELKTGKSFAAARWVAIQQAGCFSDLQPAPNTILAIEYIRAIREAKLPMEVCPIIRQGESYHSQRLGLIPSATGLRAALANQMPWHTIKSGLPESSAQLLQKAVSDGYAPVFPNAIGELLLYRLRTSTPDFLRGLAQVEEGIENRLSQAAEKSGTLQELLLRLDTKRYPRTRLQRMLLAILLGVTQLEEARFDAAGIGYLSVLGANSKGLDWLKAYRQNKSWPVIQRGREVRELLNTDSVQAEILATDIRASDIYSLLLPKPEQKKGGYDFRSARYYMD